MRKFAELFRPRAIIGLIIIVVAMLILLENLGISIFQKVLGNWPLALIIIGAAMIYGPNKGKNRAAPTATWSTPAPTCP